jgi:regulator of replication initiation timing
MSSVIDTLKKELDTAKKIANILTSENGRLKWDIDRMSWDVRNMTEAMNRIRERALSQDRTITILYQENQSLRAELDVCKDQICRERGNTAIANRNLDSAQLQMTSLQEEIEGLRACLDSALDHNHHLKDEDISLQTRISQKEADPGSWSSSWPKAQPRDSHSTISRFHPYRQEPAPTNSFSLSAERGSTSYAEMSRQPGIIDPALDAFQMSESQDSRLPSAAERNGHVNVLVSDSDGIDVDD